MKSNECKVSTLTRNLAEYVSFTPFTILGRTNMYVKQVDLPKTLLFPVVCAKCGNGIIIMQSSLAYGSCSSFFFEFCSGK